MKIKSALALTLTAVLALSMMTACTKKDEGGTTGSMSPSSDKPSSTMPVKVESGKLKEAHEAVKKAYGELYIPSMAYEPEQQKEIFGIDSAWIKEIVAEGPMISVHVDTFIGVEAAEGKAEDVEKALNAYKEKLITDSMQYPMNLPKVKAAEVIRVDDYVFFLLLGDTEKITATTNEDDQLKAAQAEVKKAVDAVESVIKK